MKLCICGFAILIATSIANASSGAPLNVSLNELMAHPRSYNGKTVSVTAYFASSCEFCFSIWPDVRTARDLNSFHKRIAIGHAARGVRIAEPPRNFDGYVHVVGTFHYRYLWRREYVRHPRTDPERVVVEANVGYGGMGLDDKEITNIAEFRILGPRIPLGIW